ncbi:uncharacterized protein GBIM_13907, partial [Gryllus bimaculatus]
PAVAQPGATEQAAAAGRQARFLSYSRLAASEHNKIDKDDSDDATDADLDAENETDGDKGTDPTSALSGMYSDCLMQLSFSCVQKKVLVFLDRLGRLDKFLVLGDFLSVVRLNKERAALQVAPGAAALAGDASPLTERALDARLQASQ